MLYLLTLRTLYGYIKSSLLSHSLYNETLEEEGYKLNPYNYCIANKTISYKQSTIAWYIAINRASHVNPKVVEDLLNKIRSFFGKMTVTRVKRHTFIGMDLSIVDPRIKVNMMYQLLKGIDYF